MYPESALIIEGHSPGRVYNINDIRVLTQVALRNPTDIDANEMRYPVQWEGLVACVELLLLDTRQTLEEKWLELQQALRESLGAAQRRAPIMHIGGEYDLDDENLLPFRDRYIDILTQAMPVVDFVYNTIEWAAYTNIDFKTVEKTITRILKTGELELEPVPELTFGFVYSVWLNESNVGKILWEMMAYYARQVDAYALALIGSYNDHSVDIIYFGDQHAQNISEYIVKSKGWTVVHHDRTPVEGMDEQVFIPDDHLPAGVRM